MATLNLPDGPRTLVWRLLVAQLAGDATLSGAIRTLITWDGDDEAAADLSQKRAPALRLLPVPGPMGWFTPDTFRGYLVVAVEAWIAGLDVEDLLNLQHSIEDALYPDDAGVFERSLVAAGAITGQVEFTSPLSTPPAIAGASNGWKAIGQFRIEVSSSTLPSS